MLICTILFKQRNDEASRTQSVKGVTPMQPLFRGSTLLSTLKRLSIILVMLLSNSLWHGTTQASPPHTPSSSASLQMQALVHDVSVPNLVCTGASTCTGTVLRHPLIDSGPANILLVTPLIGSTGYQ